MIARAARTSSASRSRDYEKTIRFDASAEKVFEAITSTRLLAKWWTRVSGSGELGGELRFTFDSEPVVMDVETAVSPTTVEWSVRSCDIVPDWVGTHPTFHITPKKSGCELRFRHLGLKPALECFDICQRGWDHYLGSLHDLVETGRGSPYGSRMARAKRV